VLFRSALGVFQQARDQLKTGSAPVSEVLWFFIGREELTLATTTASQPSNPGPEQAAHLANAEAAFKQSAAINPSYARAFIGLGGVYFYRAQTTASPDRLKGTDLAAAIQNYQQALALAPTSPGALLDTKARLGLVSVWILQGEALRDTGQMADAASSFDRAIQTATEALQPLIEAKQFRVLAQAYLSLGEAYHEQGHLKLVQGDVSASKALFELASQNYGLCIQQKDAAPNDQTLADTIVKGFCIPYKQSVDSSLAQLK
jgi:tetratricopeptide (TPR) repeat protein